MRVNFETEEELTTKDRAKTMSFTPYLTLKDNYIISQNLNRDVFRELDKHSRMFLSNERIDELKGICDSVAILTEGRYRVAVMSYEDLSYTIQNDMRTIVVPRQFVPRQFVVTPPKNKIFAVVDDETRVVGFYIPKSQRQRIIEKKINQALSDLREYFASKGATMNEEIGAVLAKFLWQQQFPYHIPYINIRAIRYQPKGMTDEIALPDGRRIQIEFQAAKGTVYYHIK